MTADAMAYPGLPISGLQLPWLPKPQQTYNAPMSSATNATVVSRDTDIPGTPYRLASDLDIELQFSPGRIVAYNSWIDDYGAGPDAESAIANLLLSLTDFRDSLERRQQATKLSDELLDTLRKLRLLLQRKDR